MRGQYHECITDLAELTGGDTASHLSPDGSGEDVEKETSEGGGQESFLGPINIALYIILTRRLKISLKIFQNYELIRI